MSRAGFFVADNTAGQQKPKKQDRNLLGFKNILLITKAKNYSEAL